MCVEFACWVEFEVLIYSYDFVCSNCCFVCITLLLVLLVG